MNVWLIYRGGWKVRLIDLPIPIRSSDCIGWNNRLMSSSDFCISRFCQFVLSSASLIDRSCFLVLSSDFCIWRLCRSVLSSKSLINRSCFLVLSSDFCIVRLWWPVLSKKLLYWYFIKIKNRLKIAAAGQIWQIWAEFCPILYKKGRKGAKLLKTLFTFSFSL
jgi:hypothetical protein